MSVTYLTNNEWALRKGNTTLAAYNSDANAFPGSSQLNSIREDSFALINEKIGIAVTKTNFLRKLEYDLVEIMLDTEVVRTTRQVQIIEVLNSYITPEWLSSLDAQDSEINRTATPN